MPLIRDWSDMSAVWAVENRGARKKAKHKYRNRTLHLRPLPPPPFTVSMQPTPRSTALFAAARRVIPGGVNSPVRAFRGVGGEPFFVDRAQGARVWDVD